MKVSVDNSHCEAQGQCALVAPDFFTLDEDGYSTIGTDKPVPAGREEEIREGVTLCPMAALTSEE